jgi:hypothetical protein
MMAGFGSLNGGGGDREDDRRRIGDLEDGQWSWILTASGRVVFDFRQWWPAIAHQTLILSPALKRQIVVDYVCVHHGNLSERWNPQKLGETLLLLLLGIDIYYIYILLGRYRYRYPIFFSGMSLICADTIKSTALSLEFFAWPISPLYLSHSSLDPKCWVQPAKA